MQFIRQPQQMPMSAHCCSNMSIFLWSCGNKAPARSCEKEDFWFLKTTLKKKNKTKSSYWWDAWTDTTRDSVSSWLLTCNGGENKTPQWCCAAAENMWLTCGGTLGSSPLLSSTITLTLICGSAADALSRLVFVKTSPHLHAVGRSLYVVNVSGCSCVGSC